MISLQLCHIINQLKKTCGTARLQEHLGAGSRCNIRWRLAEASFTKPISCDPHCTARFHSDYNYHGMIVKLSLQKANDHETFEIARRRESHFVFLEQLIIH